MPMSAREVADLRKRCVYARDRNFNIALASELAAQLGYKGGGLPPGVKEFSPQHLLLLIGKLTPTAAEKFVSVGKAVKRNTPILPPRQEDIPTVPIDVRAVRSVVEAMRRDAEEDP